MCVVHVVCVGRSKRVNMVRGNFEERGDIMW